MGDMFDYETFNQMKKMTALKTLELSHCQVYDQPCECPYVGTFPDIDCHDTTPMQTCGMSDPAVKVFVSAMKRESYDMKETVTESESPKGCRMTLTDPQGQGVMLPDGIFDQMTAVTYLKFQSIKLYNTFDETFNKMTALKTLELSHCQVYDQPCECPYDPDIDCHDTTPMQTCGMSDPAVKVFVSAMKRESYDMKVTVTESESPKGCHMTLTDPQG